MKTRKVPLRKCTGCQEMKDKRELIRVVKDGEGHLSIDITGKKSGRGAYICRSGECLEKAIKTKGLERSFQMAIQPEIYETLQREMAGYEQ